MTPTPTPPTEKCEINVFSSRGCERGTKSCVVRHTTDTGWGETFEKLLERYADYDGDSDTMYFKTVVPNMERRNLDDNYQIFLVKAKELIQHIAKAEYERGVRDMEREAKRVMATYEAALETPS